MGLFSKKKTEEKQELPPLRFPEFNKELPSYESSIPTSEPSITKKAAVQSMPSINIPIRKPMPTRTEEKGFPMQKPQERFRPEERTLPRMEERRDFKPKERTLYIKIEKYKDLVAKIDEIKAKVGEAERTLQKLNQLKTEEEGELRTWQNELGRIKDMLMNIDRNLFE